jgi:hypothetical protein
MLSPPPYFFGRSCQGSKNTRLFPTVPKQECDVQRVSVPARLYLKPDVYWGYTRVAKEGQSESHVGRALAPTDPKPHVKTHGSVDRRCVPGEDGHSSLRLFHFTQQVGTLYKERTNNSVPCYG